MPLNQRFASFSSTITIVLSLVLLGLAAIFAVIRLGASLEADATASARLQEGDRIAHAERPGTQACVACHGATGEGNRTLGAPRIAGLAADYIEKQLRDFARNPMRVGVTLDPIARDYSKTPRVQVDLSVYTPGVRRDEAMNTAAATLGTAEMQAVALYFSSLPHTIVALASDPETLERGEDLALRGKPEYGVPACTSCHGPEGRGAGGLFPPLVGQAPEYLMRQLNNWQTGTRDNDTMALMRNIADQLTDGDKINVVAYFANISAAPTTGK